MADQEFSANGSLCGWAELEISLPISGGKKFTTRHFSAADWDETIEWVKIDGTGSMPVGRVKGAQDANGSLTFSTLEAYDEFTDALHEVNSEHIADVEFDANLSFCTKNQDGSNGRVREVILRQCKMAGRSGSYSKGNGAPVPMPLSIMYAEVNGKRL